MDRSMGLEILELILSERIHARRGFDECGFCRYFLDHSFRRGAGSEDIRLRVDLKDKIIGIGAPAHAFLPSVAEKLGTQAVVPFYAGVANAVGAITSAIVIREELFVKPYCGGFRIHASSGVAFFETLEEATEEGKERLREIVLRKAKEAGAGEVETILDEKESWAIAGGGDSVFIEKTITARAMGNPRIYCEAVSKPSMTDGL